MPTERKFLVGGNWKMNGSKDLVKTLTKAINDGKWNPDTLEVVIAPPAPYLETVRASVRKDVGVAAQNIHAEEKGAFTGEISISMLKDLGLTWTILGHSERRTLFGETDELIAIKAQKALSQNLSVIYCIGESLAERESDKTKDVVYRQLKALKAVLNEAGWKHVVIAYEPVWAIGTGKVATPQQAQDVHKWIRTWLTENVSKSVSDATRILYGGSVSPSNCKDLQSLPDVDGFLVGGASLKPVDFLAICQCKL